MKQLDSELNAQQRVLLTGPPGCGKTARVHDVFARAKIPLIVWRASLMERVDISGCLVPDLEHGTTRQLPFHDVQRLAESKTQVGLFADDLGQAPIDVQAGFMRLFDSETFSRNVIIWAATNRPQDAAGCTRLCEPLRSRFDAIYAIPTYPESGKSQETSDGAVMLGDWKDELDGWVNWALDHLAPAEVIAWHRSTNGKNLYQWKPCADPSIRMPDYRTWGSVITRWNAGMRSVSQLAACIGKPAASEFLAFANLTSKLPVLDQIWMAPDSADVPTEPSSLWLLSSVLAGAVTAATCDSFCRYIARLPRIYTALAAIDAFRRIPQQLSGNPSWLKWFSSNQGLWQKGGN